MNIKNTVIPVLFAAFAAAAISCEQEPPVEFALDGNEFNVEATGGTCNVEVSSPGEWVATTNVPWITVSPANGKGSEMCSIIVDSSVVFTSEEPTRKGIVRISVQDNDPREITVTQKNFPYQITLADAEVTIPNFDDKENRWFEVLVKTNVDFTVDPKYQEDPTLGIEGGWLEVEQQPLELDRGARPRNVKLKFTWDINSVPEDRSADVNFVPAGNVDESYFSELDVLNVLQTAAARIKENSREGDSTALIGIAQALGVWQMWDASIPMTRWSGVELWESDDENLDGRVKSATFYMYKTEDYIPFQVQYLTAAEELVFYSNENSFRHENLDIGPYILELGGDDSRLKRLTISAHGIEDLPDEFSRLKNLEYLDLSSNNFRKIPDVLTPENFPNLHALLLNTNQRSLVYDLSNITVTEDLFSSKYGGLFEENLRPENDGCGFPRRFLTWNKLDTLTLGVNYLEGELPSDEDLLAMPGIEAYTDADYVGQDTLATYLKDHNVPKVLTNLKRFTINHNRFTGVMPDWLMYHPNFDLWDPLVLVFSQEGKMRDGSLAGFSNEKTNLDYYYKEYPNKRFAPDNSGDGE